MKKYLVLPLAAVALAMTLSCAQAQRGGAGMGDLVLRLQQLETEVKRLRGQVEMQKHAIDALKRRQRDLYMDLDSRISAGAGGVPAAGSTAPPLPPPAPTASSAPPPAPEAAAPPPAPAPEPVTAPPLAAPIDPVVSGDPGSEKEAYQQAFGLLKDGRYDASIEAFKGFMAKYPDGRYVDNALYWMGEANYVNRNFSAALGSFDRLLQQFPASPKVPGALLKTGYVHYEQRDWSRAREALQRLEREHPGSTEAQLAGQRLDRMRRAGH